MIMYYKKCKECPYYLGEIKCIVSPCLSCLDSGKAEPPFQKPVRKDKSSEKGRRPKNIK